MRKKFYKIEEQGGYCSYYKINGKRLLHGDKIELLLGQCVYKTEIIVELHSYQGSGGMDESSSWEDISCIIHDGCEFEVKLKEDMKIRRI